MPSITRRSVLRAAGGGALLSSLPSFAQHYPSKLIKYIVPVSAGGGSDMVGRAVSERLSRVLGQTLVVENIPGAGGTIACQSTARAAPDGYTLMQGYVATHGVAPATRKLPYDAVKDFTPVAMIGATPNVLAVNVAVPAQSYKDLIDYLKANVGKVSYGSAGPGTLTHLTGEMFKQLTDTDMVHVPYKGIAPATTDLLGGQTQVMFPGLAAILPHLKGGKVRVLGVTGKARHALLPDVPTLEELGLAGFSAMQWYGIVGPAKMPADVVKVLNSAVATVLAQADFREKLLSEAVAVQPMSPEAFGEFIKADVGRWTQLAKARGIQLES